MRSKRGLLRLGGLIVAGALATAVLSACGGASEGPGASSPSANTSGSTATAASPTTVKIVLKDNVFEPAAVTIPVGKDITIEYENQGAVMHNLVAEGFSSPMMQAGDKGTMKVKFDKAGQVKFLCAFHQPGMDGVFTVK